LDPRRLRRWVKLTRLHSPVGLTWCAKPSPDELLPRQDLVSVTRFACRQPDLLGREATETRHTLRLPVAVCEYRALRRAQRPPLARSATNRLCIRLDSAITPLYLAPTASETKAIGQIKGAISRSPSLGPDFDLAATHLHRLALPAPALALFDPIASLRVRAP
jgi:hypothetical protein